MVATRLRESNLKFFGHARKRLKIFALERPLVALVAVCTPFPQQRAGRCVFVGLLDRCIAKYRGTGTSSCAFAALKSELWLVCAMLRKCTHNHRNTSLSRLYHRCLCLLPVRPFFFTVRPKMLVVIGQSYHSHAR